MANFNSVTPELAEQLKAIVGEKRFQYGDKVKEDYSHDEMPIYGKFAPEAVCELESTEEVSAILKLCNENIPVKNSPFIISSHFLSLIRQFFRLASLRVTSPQALVLVYGSVLVQLQ